MNRYLATSLLATMTGSVLVFVAHGCALNPFADYSPEEARTALGEPSSSTGGGRGGAGGAGGGASCTCIDDDNECTDDVVGPCPDASVKLCHTAVANRNCTLAGEAGYCDAAGTCTACEECSDDTCTKRCNGQVCQTGAVCVSGNCVDGYCCNSDCVGECNACNRVAGTCSRLPAGWDDCETGFLCGNMGTCKTAAKAPLGALCASASACESGVCLAQVCVSPNGQPCVDPLECESNLCDPTTHKCVECDVNNTCPAGASCVAGGRCQVLLGQPAANENECIPPAKWNDKLTCTLPVDETCTNDSECIYHSCIGPSGSKKCDAACTSDAACPTDTTCNTQKGWCRLPSKSYCVVNDQCVSLTCEGFPRRCQ